MRQGKALPLGRRALAGTLAVPVRAVHEGAETPEWQASGSPAVRHCAGSPQVQRQRQRQQQQQVQVQHQQ